MNIWIVTTGSSDVKLETDKHWSHLYIKAKNQYKNLLRFEPAQPPNADDDEPFVVPARAMGMVYGGQLDEYYKDLKFPLLDTFSQTLKAKSIPDKIIVILTDQEAAFEKKDKELHHCPYWQDTCALKPIFEKYLQGKFSKAKQEYLYLNPPSKSEGLDNWDKALALVQKVLSNVEFAKIATIYVSHQAGTPAISSAIQFVSLARFGKRVNFLVSNEYEKKPATLIKSSEYLRGIQVQQVKGLIKSGAPGAAMQLLELEEIKAEIDSKAIAELEKLVDFFNLNRSFSDGNSELDIESATQRIVDALELIRIFFEQNNYLLGIALLAAAQETFLKVAILSKVAGITEQINLNGRSCKVSELVEWSSLGLFLSNSVKRERVEVKRNILKKLNFPIEKYQLESDDNFKITNRNFALITWLEKLEPNFQPWSLLKWSCEKYRNSDDDLRNQLLHNLRGMESTEVSQYLSGNATPSDPTNVVKTYDNLVKVPFMREIQRFGLKYTREKLGQKLQALAESLGLAL